MRLFLAISIQMLMSFPALCAVDTMTGIFNDKIKTLEVHVDGNDMAPPVITLGSDDRLTVSFDHLDEDRCYLRYELIHCNADWQRSGLVDSEFLDGFNVGYIDDYDFSRATTVHYVHYTMSIPNGYVTPKLSGNYLLRIYPENNPDDTWLQCRFMVSEQTAVVSGEITSRTDVDYNKAHQQLSLAIDTERSGVRDPFNDVTVMIQQNGRYDNEISVRQPLRVSGKISYYEHQSPLIFDAGNEYRRFEVVSTTYPGMKVEEIGFAAPYYHAILSTDSSRAGKMYEYDQTQHGRFTIREYSSSESDIEADYIVVHFSLDYPELPGTMIFLDGDFTSRRFDPESLMTFNRATGRYERVMLLKQGAYNYQYLAVPPGKDRGYTSIIEGDDYQTVNEYMIKVYHRRPGERYDRLIGVASMFSGQ